uniref:Uncharacterized protein n=1 Tax=Anguilla anguilla TaxID=7936 RepID=A0A0E9WHS2_ANGAN
MILLQRMKAPFQCLMKRQQCRLRHFTQGISIASYYNIKYTTCYLIELFLLNS